MAVFFAILKHVNTPFDKLLTYRTNTIIIGSKQGELL